MKSRDTLMRPMANLLTKLRIHPHVISIFGIFSMVSFVWLTMQNHPFAGLFFLVISVVTDLTDGVVARYRNIDSYIGRIIDLVCDTTNFVLFTVTIVIGKRVLITEGLILAILFILAMWKGAIIGFKAAKNNGEEARSVRGFWIGPSTVKAIMYIAFVMQLITTKDILGPIGAGCIALLTISFAYIRPIR